MARAKRFHLSFAHGAAPHFARRDDALLRAAWRVCGIEKQHCASSQRALVLRVTNLESCDGSESRRHRRDNTFRAETVQSQMRLSLESTGIDRVEKQVLL